MPAAPVKVTVLTTLYNKGAYVEEAVRSVLANTFTDFELLVVDDASTDDGLEKVKAISDPRIRILESAVNTGRAAAANRGFDAARGEYVAVLDADDVAHPERLAKQVAFMDARPDVGVSGTAYQAFGQKARSVSWPSTDLECRTKLLFRDPVLYGSSIIRRSVMEQHALRCDATWRRPGMDYLFICGFHPYTHYANLDEVLLYYRSGENNMRHGRSHMEDRAHIVQGIFKILELPLSEAELTAQLAYNGLFREAVDARGVRQLFAWKAKLTALNRARMLFPTEAFEQELEDRWENMFHALADRDLGAGIAHFRLSGKWPMDRMAYLAKTTLNRWTGRKR